MLQATGNAGRFRYNAENRLPADVVVVDEASMVDLALMARLVAAVPDAARLIVLGDRDQLASVEAGAVFGDICHPGADGRYTEGFRKAYRSAAGQELPKAGGHPAERAPLLDRITVLRKNYRFGEDSAVGRLARAVTAGDPDAVIACLAAGDPAVQWHRPGGSDFDAFLWNAAREGYRDLSGAADPRSAIEGLDRFRILCALRVGPLGAHRLSERVEERVRDRLGVGAGGRWYPGRPVVVTRNDYASGLFNGDCGVAMAEDGGLRVFFEGRQGGLRRFHPARIPEHESVWATTVHKSQGSEYDEVLLVLPASDAPVLTRELLYTAVTRARRRVALWGDEAIVRAAVARRVERASGLMERLWPVTGTP
jgi:exodeoxyribonuclease V alpha subunit